MDKHGGDIYGNQNIRLDYSVNVNPFGMPESVRTAAARALDRCGCYPDSQCRELKRGIAGFYGLKEEWIVCGNGAAELIYCLAQARRPRRALILAPTFSEYENALLSVGCRVDYYELGREKNFELDEELIPHLSPDLDMVFLCNPNNPTGAAAGREVMEKILKACREQGILLAVDECFMEFVDGGQDISLASRLEPYQNLFLLKAFTKSFAMAGLRLGYGMCSDARLLAKLETCRQPWSVSLIAQEAGIAALREEDYLRETRRVLKEERSFLSKGLRALGFSVFESKANYLLFHGDEDGSLYRHALSQGILIRDCSNYRGLLKGDYRICVGLHHNNIRLLEVLKKVKEEKR